MTDLVGFRGRRSPQRGQAIMGVAIILPVLALILGAAVALGPLLHIHIVTQQAAYDCAIAAAQSLDAAQGYTQGLYAAQASFRSFNLRPGRADISVRGDWKRNGMVVCEVVYRVPTEAFPFHAVLSPPSTVRYTISVPPHAFKSIWR